MSIQSPVGTLDIKNATLRVGKLEVSNIQGVDTALNVTRANSVLIYDDQASTTTFTGFTSSASVRDTSSGYLDVANGHVYWGQKLPNSWVMDFEMDIRSGTSPGPLYANVFSTTATEGDGYSFTFNDNNDKISLYYDGTLLTEATVSGLFTASENWQKVAINYERGMIAISLGGSRKFYYKDIERETPYVNGEYTSFSSASTDGRKIRKLRIVNGEKWMYTGESNVVYTQGSVGIGVTDPQYTLDVGGDINLSGSFYQGGAPFVSSLWTDGADSLYYRSNVEVGTANLFVDTTTSRVGINTTTPGYDLDVNGDINFTGTFYQGGSPFVSSLWTGGNDSLYYTASNVGIGTDTAEYTLDVHGNANVGALTATSVSGDGSALYGIQSSNVSDFASNVTRIETLETDLSDNSSRIGVLETDLSDNSSRIGVLETDLSDNSSRITSIESGTHTFTGIKTFESDVILESNLRVNGDLLVANTVHMIVSDPIMELGANNLNTGDLGIIMTRHGESGNVAIIFDESTDTLEIGYTTGNHMDTTITIDDSSLFHTNIHGNVSVSNLDIGQFSVVPSYGLDHVTNENNSTGDTLISTNATTGLQTTANVSIGRDALVSGNVEVSQDLTVTGNVEVSQDLTVTGAITINTVSLSTTTNLQEVTNDGNTTTNTVEFTNPTTAFVTTGNVEVGGELTVSGNVEVGAANLFVDTETGRVGIGTTNPTQKLDVRDGSAFIERDVIVNELDSLPALTTHGTLGREDLYTWEGSARTIVNTANQQNEPFYYNSDSSFKRLQTVGTATLNSNFYTNKWNNTYMIYCDAMDQDSRGNITTPTNYTLLSLPVAWLNNKTSSHSLFLKFITRDRWSSACAYVTNSSKTSFYRLQGNVNTLNDSAETASRNLWYGPDGGFSYGQSYHEWQMFSIPEHVIEEYSYSETRDGKSKYNRNINIAFTTAYGNTDGDHLYWSGIAMRTNPYGLTYHNALCAAWAINGGYTISWYADNWADLGILGQITSGTNYTNILIPICPPKDPDVHGYPDFYLGYIGHRAQDQYEKRGRFYLQHSNGTYKYIGRPSHIYGGRFGKDILGMLMSSRCAPNNGLYVSIPSSDYIAKVGGRPYLRIRIDNTDTNGWTGDMHPLGFYTEVVYKDGSKDGLGDNGQQYI